MTSSQWLGIDTLSRVLRECLPIFPEGNLAYFPETWARANHEKIKLFEFLTRKVGIEHRVVEQVVTRCHKIKDDPEDVGIRTRTIEYDVSLRVEYDVPLPTAMEFFLSIRLKMEMVADCNDWHVDKICFLPIGNQMETLYQGEQLEYQIV